MTPERWERIKTVLTAALEMEPRLRKEYARQASGGDSALYDEIVSLLDSDSEQTLLRNPVLETAQTRGGSTVSDERTGPALEPASSSLAGEGAGTSTPLKALAALSAAYLQQSFAPSGMRIGCYRLLDAIGEGGMGVVYRAYDETRKQLVALKTLQRMSPGSLYRFKREFRGFAELNHPNLVNLYELLCDGGRWCFTMELVHGSRLMTRLPRTAAERTADDIATLRDVFIQLAEGVAALHSADKLHRDIKPSNVLVTPEGRVVLVDFGLGADVDDTGMYQTTDRHVLGTVGYVSPEQAAGKSISFASDWYSVGVMLYEALTGRLPFEGNPVDVLRAKLDHEAPSPAEIAPGVPDDLNALCVDLLRQRATERPSELEVLRRLGQREVRRGPSIARESLHEAPFVGRSGELALLRNELQTIREGSPVIAHVHGNSGAGKTALVQRFLDEAGANPQTVILAGRCYEHESVPFKALDSLIDALAQYLRRLPAVEVQAVMPRDVRPLARVFPVLWQVTAIAEAPDIGGTVSDPQELRRRAGAALRELLARLGDRQTLILWIDDLQWGDLDSAILLTDLLTPPDPPVFLGILSYRAEDVPSAPFFAYLESRSRSLTVHRERQVAVSSLDPSDTRDLIAKLLPPSVRDGNAVTEAIARESAGLPFLVYELVQHARESSGGSTGARPLTLNEAIQRRIERLTDETRRLLEIVAVAGRPIATLDACRAAGVTSDDRGVLPHLKSGRLIRSTASTQHDTIEPYHDRVRECVLARLAPETRREHHRRLADLFSSSATADSEALALHLEGGGDPERAAEYFARAASAAADALAFDHAAELYRRALELGAWNPAEACALHARRGDALSNAGRGADAATAYLSAAAGAGSTLQLELQRRAALQLLTSGHVDEGLACLTPVLEAVGTRLAAKPWRALLSLLVRRAQLRVRGIGFERQREDTIDPTTLQRIDVGWSAVVGLSVIDPIRGADFQTRSLLLALKAGEPFRIARALAVEAGHLASSGSIRRARTILDRAEELAADLESEYAVAINDMARGTVAYFDQKWRDALRLSRQASARFREQCPGATWELDTATAFSVWSLAKMGDIAELSRISPALLKEAHERGDLYAIANLSTQIMTLVRLGADDPDGARAELNDVMTRWSQNGYHVQHHDALLAYVPLELYCLDPASAWHRVQAEWSAFRWSLLSHVQDLRIEMVQLRAYCALAMAAAAPVPGPFLAVAARDARRLRRERLPWTETLARYIDGAVALRRGADMTGRESLAAAVDGFERIEAHLHAAATRWQLGQIVGGSGGGDMCQSAERWFTSHRVVSPRRLAAAYAPGLS